MDVNSSSSGDRYMINTLDAAQGSVMLTVTAHSSQECAGTKSQTGWVYNLKPILVTVDCISKVVEIHYVGINYGLNPSIIP